MLENEVTFSIIVPTYNRAKLLKRCLDSLNEQTYNNFEVLICDDGSTDETREVVESFSSLLNLKYLWDENWGGPAKPRNRGIHASMGAWICFLDSDDWFYPNKLEEIVRNIPDNDCLYHDLDIYDKNTKKIGKISSRQLKDNIVKDLLLNGTIPNSSVCVKRKLIKEINGFSEKRDLIAVEDADCWLRLAEITTKFKYIPMSLGAYYVGDNISFSEKQIERLEAYVSKNKNKLQICDQNKLAKITNYSKGVIYQRSSLPKQARVQYLKSLSWKQPKLLLKSIFRIISTFAK